MFFFWEGGVVFFAGLFGGWRGGELFLMRELAYQFVFALYFFFFALLSFLSISFNFIPFHI